MPRVLAIGLDGFEQSFARRLMDQGELPCLRAIEETSANFLLDHGPAQRTGLAWEHVSTGLAPQAADRWAAVHFDARSYSTWQEGTRLPPFPAALAARTVVFDPPYFDLGRAPAVRGIVNWGAHDPGVPSGSRPDELTAQCAELFGPYPARDFLYGFVWPSAARTATMGAALTRAVELRTAAARWLLAERVPDWDLGIVVVSELHSVIEALWHGVDPTHPLHDLPSAQPAHEGMVAVYRAVDRLIGELATTFPDATLVVFAMGGMGPNRSDVPSMVLLPELLYRRAFGEPLLQAPAQWPASHVGFPLVAEDAWWAESVTAHMPAPRVPAARALAAALLPASLRRALKNALVPAPAVDTAARLSLDWMPATRYRPFWHRMDAFALPSFYDGRIRVNLAGRERSGRTSPSGYTKLLDDIEALLRECRDPQSGEGVVELIERPSKGDPLELGPTESDMVVVWKGCSPSLTHPTLGTVGPVPLRRTGGHTGPFGMACLRGENITPGDRGIRSAFDVVPTIVDLLSEPAVAGMSGRSLLA